MKILCLTPWFPSHRQDQTGNFILDSVESLVRLGHELKVLVSEPWRPAFAGCIHNDWIKKERAPKQFNENLDLHICKHISIPRNYFRPISNFFYQKKINPLLEKLVKKYQCELIHAHTELPGLAAVTVGKHLGIPTVVTVHGINTDKKLYAGSTRKLLFEHTLSCANRVVLVGDPLKIFLKNFVKNDNHFRVVYNGFRFHEQQLNQKIWTNHPRFISVSNLHEGKGIDLNLLALSKLKEHGNKNWTYKIIGDGYERIKLETLVDTLNLRGQVSFLGAIAHDNVYRELMEADIFTLPSYREAFGIAYLEAMSFGLLAIGVKGQGSQAFIEHEKTGFLVPPKDINALTQTFEKVFASYDKIQTIAEAGKNHVLKHFTWQSHAENLTSIYKELLP